MDYTEKYEVVIGLEAHSQLITQSKIFNSNSTEFGNLPNTNVDVHTLAHPGTLPRLNKRVVEFAMKMGIACKSEISRFQYFDRKNYFYPDLPKGYQTTQDKTPICRGGSVPIKLKNGTVKNIGLTKIHMEEDAGKSHHLDGETDSLVDLNRAGVPLIEIVTEPEIRNADEATAFMQEIRRLVRYLEISDGNMDEGSLRCDVNISLRPKGATYFGKKVEVKNLNSFGFVRKAIEYEIDRQGAMLEAGIEVPSETRTFDTSDFKTYSLRTKEDLNDYRYFPEPDLQPFTVSDVWLNEVKSEMPPLPQELYDKFTKNYQLPDYDVNVLIESKDIALYFDRLCAQTKYYKTASNWMMGPIKSYLNELTLHINNFPVSPERIAEVIDLVESGKVSNSMATQKLFPELTKSPEKSAMSLAESLNLLQNSSDDFIVPLIEQVLASFPDKVKEYKAGKVGLIGLFVGEVMKKAQGKADPKKTNQMVKEILDRV
ncbi:MAG: Asp-tRNA(Asn)/Glu-tRNA(Gln) amidotransferase subunit GatB [Bacteroidota bacterium]|nr:Asp-tRNA(Asn)/Glu-tRNA(Gln) amidotransferase subunit GatB [Bacteroidota bacterium]